jgi:hypothetical protein
VEWGEREGGSKGGLLQFERHRRIKPAHGAATGRWSTARQCKGRVIGGDQQNGMRVRDRVTGRCG